MRRVLIIGIVVVIALVIAAPFALPAKAQQIFRFCAPADAVFAKQRILRRQVVFIGSSPRGAVVTIFFNPDDRSWFVITNEHGLACMEAFGENGHVYPPKIGDPA